MPITLNGANFLTGTMVTAANPGITVGKVVLVSATQITATLTVSSYADLGSANLTVTTSAGSATIPFTVIAPPGITGLSPSPGVGGQQIVITGARFGATQVTGSAVWLGTAPAHVVSWSDTQVTAIIAANSRSGSAQVERSGVWGIAVPFNAVTATISTVTPASGVPGTPVTITGTGFGATQGTGGKVWLGTLPGEVQSWSDTVVVAKVAAARPRGRRKYCKMGF